LISSLISNASDSHCVYKLTYYFTWKHYILFRHVRNLRSVISVSLQYLQVTLLIHAYSYYLCQKSIFHYVFTTRTLLFNACFNCQPFFDRAQYSRLRHPIWYTIVCMLVELSSADFYLFFSHKALYEYVIMFLLNVKQ